MEKDQEKQNLTMVKINTLSQDELSEIQLGDLWILKPSNEMPSASRFCGCRNICIV